MTDSQFIRALPGPLRQPQNLATLISVGFHTLVFIGLAAMPLVSTNQDDRIVDLVTLSPSELQQLPPSSTTALPPGATETLPVPLPPGLESYIPGDSALIPVPDMPLPEPPPVGMPPRQDLFPAPLGPLLPMPSPDSGRWIPNNPRWRTPAPGNTSPVGPIGPVPLPPPQTAAATPPAAPPEATGNPTVRPAISDSGALGGMSTWLSGVYTQFGQNNVVLGLKTPLSYSYPKAACAQKLSGQVYVGAVFAAQSGTLVSGPTVLRTSQQPILDEAAINAVKSAGVESTGMNQARTFTFDFQYSEEACGGTGAPAPSAPAPSGAPASTPRPSSPTPSTSPAPADKPKPSPAASPSAPPADKPSPAPATPAPTPEPAAPSPSPPTAPSPPPEAPAAPTPAPS
jgi:Gram-negative bacterial TonB protein C-terminal